jgi:hypothetical protein
MKSSFKIGLFVIFSIGFWNQSSAQNRFSKSEVYTEIIIEREASEVWKMLADFESYSMWHPYLKSVEGEKKIGNKLTFFLSDSTAKKSTFKAFLLSADTNQNLAWGGSLGFLFRAKHYFEVQVIDDNSCKLIQGEYWKGWFGSNYGKKIYKKTYENFISMNSILKEILEKK